MKPKLLLLHGALGSKKQFETVRQLLVQTFDVYDLNFEGHGGSVSGREFSMELFSSNVVDFLAEKSIAQTDVFGYSMGGYVALHVAKHFPGKINKIVTLGTKFNWDIASATKEASMLDPEKIAEKVPQFANELREEHHPEDWKKVVKKTAALMMALSEGGQLQKADFQQITHAVVIGIGSLDTMAGVEDSAKVASLLPNGRLRILDGVKHPIQKIAPADLAIFIHEALGATYLPAS